MPRSAAGRLAGRASSPTARVVIGLAVFCASVCVFTCGGGGFLVGADSIGSTPEGLEGVPTWDVAHDLFCTAPKGPVQDLHCDVGDVEEANTEQLHGILEELANTTYFRLVKINLDAKCKFWNRSEGAKCNSSTGEELLGKPKTQCALDMSGGSKGGAKKVAFSSPPPGMGAGLFAGFPGGAGGFPFPTTDEANKQLTTKEEDLLKGTTQEKVCNDTSLPEFWLDMCRNIHTNASDYLNLNLNPERWTGYNGSHVWNAIYEENCFEQLGELDDMCYEERVLYRILSGLHASTNIHISVEFFPPSKAAGRENWTPNPERFMTQYSQFPDRLKNLHFAFVVLLRSVRRASPYLYNFPFEGEDGVEEKRTSKLVQRLLDSHIMQSCSNVFNAFDETLMFREGDEPSVQSTLKSQFKGVFQNISEVMDCISCQKCKLHGKLQLLGLGTALKILLLPEQLIASSLSRHEIVALFNTLHKFSGAIKAIPELSNLFYSKQDSYRKASILDESTKNIEKANKNQQSTPPSPPSSLPELRRLGGGGGGGALN